MASPAKRFLVVISVGAALVLALLLAARLALPGWLRGKVERLAGEATGRALTIGGPLDLSLFGSPTLSVKDVRFANVPGGSESSMVTAGRLAVSIDLRRLLSGEIHVRRVELEDVRVLLERSNWHFELPQRPPSRKKAPKVVVDEAALRNFRLVHRPGLELGIQSFTAHRDPATDMVAVDGRGDFNAAPWHLAGTVGTVASILEGRDVDQTLTGGIGQSTLSVEGHLRDPLTLGGPRLGIDVAGPDVAVALAVFGLRSPLAGPFKLEAKLSPQGDDVGVEVVAGVGGVEAKATGAVDSLLGLSRAEAVVEASGPDAAVIGGWTGVRGLPTGPFRAAGKVVWADRAVGLSDVDVAAGGIDARVSGTIGTTIELDVDARGRDLAVLRAVSTVPLPAGPFTVDGRFTRRGRVLAIGATTVHVGETTVHASGTIGTPPGCRDLDLTAEGSGPDASIFSALATVHLPAERFDVRGRVALEGGAIGLHGVEGHLGASAYGIDGTLMPVRGLAGSRARVHAGGEDLAGALMPFGVTGLPAQPFDGGGTVGISGGAYDLEGVVAHVGGMDATVEGRVSVPVTAATSLAAHVSGNHLSDLAAWGVHATLPPDPFEAEGTLRIDGGVYRVERGTGTIGSDTLTADGIVAPAYDLDLHAVGPHLPSIARFFEDGSLPHLPDTPFDVKAHARGADGGVGVRGGEGTIGNLHLAVDGTVGTATDATIAVDAPDTTVASELAGVHLPDGVLRARGRIRRKDGVTGLDGVKINLGSAYAEVSGTVGDVQSLDVDVEGPDLAAIVGPLTGLSPLPTDSFAAEGHFLGDRRRMTSEGFSARLGDSDVAGSIALAFGDKTTIDADLRSKRLDVARLISGFTEPPAEKAPAVAAKRTHVIPDAAIDLTALGRLEARVVLRADEVAFPGVPLRDVSIEARAHDGGLHVERLEGTGLNGGHLMTHAALTPADDGYAFDGGLRLDGGRFTLLLKKDGSPKDAPTLDVDTELAGKGRTLHEILGGSDGKILVQLGPGRLPKTLSSGFLVSLLDTLNPFRKTSPDTPLECGIAAAAIEDGKVVVDPIATRTDKLTILGRGKLDLSTEEINLTWTLKPRKGVGVSPGTIANTFIKLGGTLADPKIDAKPLEAAATTGAAVATAGITILLKGFYDRITAETNVCAKALKKVRKEEEKRAAATAPDAAGE
ncbi:MAG TPA: AsmA-like C-terminal region-containing protein [Candidatus Polarisedimenticolaceae bacterium]|nr:AsmA-like C-terminal region-containing protein [Candidatus Polarisedimenticolaceae bacterium]